MMNITIIGAGLACYKLVTFLRKRKYDGEIRVISRCDGHQYYKPKLSTGFSDALHPDDHITEDSGAWADKLDVTLVNDTVVTSISPETKTVHTSRGDFSYGKLVLAFGASPRAITSSVDADGALDNVNSLQSYRLLYEKLKSQDCQPLIIGAGLVGCELSSDLANAGYQPTLVSSGDYPFHGLLPRVFSEFIKGKMIEAGVRFVDRQLVVNMTRDEAVFGIDLSSGKREAATVVVNCAGLSVNTALAGQAGIATDSGILTDRYLQTNVDDIYAIGDCAQIDGQLHQYIAPIQVCARALAATMTGQATPVNLTFYPVEIKIQQSPTRFMLKEKPTEWKTEETADGMIARGYRDGQLCGFAVTGDALAQMNALVVELA
ncbi:FAD-dependent oxidoreductase [Jeongeupia naejangsanensis]|uniref:FAD-dependent oxidoreductase n=1 Tax=Jeongeupia naejangsanensis TaxID=613195 RepID=A0ABS2BI91_9NEIS|nr:FAD-dependent oxidoreductase [Jeongeupia naejangsanensis]MBM3115190.1 FAD-dependent oxidoreductase [Jeongeupia naejangsanensis]